ncbi:uncharacterized protein LOC112351211 [Selaginella moellendorffii]|uniref:uncharacterized protein LOC112351211 n=1 Tax=Selaginella moellendorffii TaxID=88036 RepID=UPI000D1C87FF|nr:uncharacterized protein LOC112351211 [Selaginella moellendorffii]|eukprot:XP_024544420.1 uncharacterized protein LOC112351211 [Selaginella moellendorffii]
MKARKRKDERHRSVSDAKRRKTEPRRGKGLLVPPPRDNNALLPCKDFFGAGGTVLASNVLHRFPDHCEPTYPKRPIPTPGYRLVDGEEEINRYREESESEEREEEHESDDRSSSHQEEIELERSPSFSNTRGCGKAIYKGLLDKNRGCNCNVLVVEFDRGWREYGATVELHSGHRGWYLCVLLQGETLFVQEIRRRFFHYSTNGFSGSFMWKADQGWMLEFKNTMQLNAFKRVFEKCYQKNYMLAASRKLPTPKFQVVKDLDTRWRGPAFIRPANGYIPTPEVNLETRVLYDMDCEDEEWLSNLNGKAGGYTKISEQKFEKMMYTLEKYSHDRNELLSIDAASEVCLHVASLKIIKLIHGYWIEKRRRNGISLVRYFQPERWKQYRDSSKKQKRHLFAFCLPPRGLEIESLPETVSSSSPVLDATDQDVPNPVGVENIESPSLPEVCDEASVPSDEKEAESREPAQTDLGFKKFVGTKEVRPQPGDLVWKKYTGRANPEEMKKLKVIHQMRQSGIKHFTRRKKVPQISRSKSSKSSKSPCNGSLTNEASSSQEGTSDLLALAEAATLSPYRKERPASSTGGEDTEMESEIETPAKETLVEKTVEASTIQERVDEMIRQRAQLEKLALKKQMSKLKQQMKMVNQQQQQQQPLVVDSSLPELEDFGTWSVEFQKAIERLEEHKRKKQQLQQVRSKDQQRVVSVSVKRTNSRFSTLLLVVANSAAEVESS